MKPIKWIAAVFKEWRQKVYDMQYQDGYDWARKTYFEGRLPIKELLEAALPVTGAFDRGVLQAVIDIERDKAARIEVNQVGEPVNVPFMVEYNPGQRHKVHYWTEDNPYIPIDPEKEKAVIEIEREMMLRTDPDLEAIETLRRRREQGNPIIRLIGSD